jgi:pimeloyl-ACP methyl ester carboxylesterase
MHHTSPDSPPPRRGPGADPATATVRLGRQRLTTAVWGEGPPSVVLLHDGLGSIGQWQALPPGLAARTGRAVLAYDRAGHGCSTPVPAGPWPVDWLHREAETLDALVEALGVDDPVLVGHSDGGSVAAIHAARAGTGAPLVLLAAHSWVERQTVREIRRMRAARDQVTASLARHHDQPLALFDAWSGVWTSPSFASWDIRGLLPAVDAPTLVVQGGRDEYASTAHAEVTARAIGDNATSLILDGRGHLLHHEDPAALIEVIGQFVEHHRSTTS